MGRTPRPWYRAAKDVWVVELDGRQVWLARGKGARREADAALRRLQVERDRGRGRLPPTGGVTVGELVASYRADLRRRVEAGELSSYRAADVQRRLAGLVEALGRELAEEIRASEVTAWVASHMGWGATTRADAVAEVRALFRWALRDRRIAANPIEGLRAGHRAERRALVIDPDEVLGVAEWITSAPFRDLYLFLALTGARPKEARSLEARHIDWDRAMAVRADHKSYHRTRKARVIHLPWPTYLIAWRASQTHPDGPIFRNSRGNVWTKDAINCQVRRIRQRSGRGAELVAYALRHGFATRLLESSGDLALGAAALGHSSTAMLSRVYGHLEGRHAHVRAAIDAISPASPSPEPTRPPERDPHASVDSVLAGGEAGQPAQPESTRGSRPRRRGRS